MHDFMEPPSDERLFGSNGPPSVEQPFHFIRVIIMIKYKARLGERAEGEHVTGNKDPVGEQKGQEDTCSRNTSWDTYCEGKRLLTLFFTVTLLYASHLPYTKQFLSSWKHKKTCLSQTQQLHL